MLSHSLLITVEKHCHLIGTKPHRIVLHADIYLCLMADGRWQLILKENRTKKRVIDSFNYIYN